MMDKKECTAFHGVPRLGLSIEMKKHSENTVMGKKKDCTAFSLKKRTVQLLCKLD